MAEINWNQFKIYKQERPNPTGLDNFQLLLEFIRNSDNLISPDDIFEILSADPLSVQMLEKRGIADTDALAEYLHKLLFR